MLDREKEASVKDTRDDLNSLHPERWAQVLCVSVSKKYIYIFLREHTEGRRVWCLISTQ